MTHNRRTVYTVRSLNVTALREICYPVKYKLQCVWLSFRILPPKTDHNSNRRLKSNNNAKPKPLGGLNRIVNKLRVRQIDFKVDDGNLMFYQIT